MAANFGYNTSGNYTHTGRQANVNQTGGSGRQVNIGGRWVSDQSPQAMQLKQKRTAMLQKNAKKYVAAQNAAEVAEINQQEVEDRITENKTRNSAMSNLAFQQAQSGGQMGRGLFQRRQSGTKISTALGSLASANAGAMKAARMKTLKAKQAADLTRTNPALGFRLAVQGLQRQLA